MTKTRYETIEIELKEEDGVFYTPAGDPFAYLCAAGCGTPVIAPLAIIMPGYGDSPETLDEDTEDDDGASFFENEYKRNRTVLCHTCITKMAESADDESFMLLPLIVPVEFVRLAAQAFEDSKILQNIYVDETQERPMTRAERRRQARKRK